MLFGQQPLLEEERRILVRQTLFHLFDRQHVAVAHHQIDVIQRDGLSLQAVVDDLLKEATGVLLARDPLLGDRKRNLAIAKQARTDIVVVRVQPKHIGVILRHRLPFGRTSSDGLYPPPMAAPVAMLGQLRAWHHPPAPPAGGCFFCSPARADSLSTTPAASFRRRRFVHATEEAMMRNLLTALAGAALLAGAATVALAQTAQTQNQTNPNTKVYAYQKATAPKPASPGTDVTMARQNHP